MTTRPAFLDLRREPHAPGHADGVLELFTAARRLRSAMRDGFAGRALQGKNIAVLRQPSQLPVHLGQLRQAAQSLGARVADVAFEPLGLPSEGRKADGEFDKGVDARRLGRMLGKFYDAVDCEVLAPEVVDAIEREANIMVFDGLCRPDHAARAMADLLSIWQDRDNVRPLRCIAFFGAADRAPRPAFLDAARRLGFEIRLASAEAVKAASPDEVLIDTGTSADWDIRIGGNPVDPARRSENHQLVIQAMLLAGMTGH
ncbi:conserved hypothetical protein [Burkholderiales bacterium 8X]|nr:conserved hypothetical protein [Burkholderiales bacterium 8X]